MTAQSEEPRLTMVLLPGMDGTGELFAPFLEVLGQDVVARVIDYPRDEPMDYDQLTEFVLQRVPNDDQLVILGESFGGPLAVRVADRLGERVAALILCCTFLRNPTPRWAPLMKMAAMFPLNRLPGFAVNHVLLSGLNDSALIRSIQRATASVRSRVLARRLKAVTRLDVSALLAKLTAPVMCIEGTNDNLVAPGTATEVQMLVPSAHTVFIDGPHCLLQVAPKVCVEQIGRFLHALDDN